MLPLLDGGKQVADSENGYRGETPFEQAVIRRLDGIDKRLNDQGGALNAMRRDVQAIQSVLTNDRAQYYEMRDRASAAGRALTGSEKT
jgi:hypothetical protein